MNQKVKLLGIEFDNLTIDGVKKIVVKFVNSDKKGYVITPNVAHVLTFQKDVDFQKACKNASLVLCDSTPLLWISKLLGKPLIERCSGADLLPKICRLASDLGKSIFILGGDNGSENIAEGKLRKMYPNIRVSSYNPPFGFEKDVDETKKIIDLINKFKTDILFICVGAPKSEKWIYNNIKNLNISLGFCFGAALNFFAGTVKRAPKWMQKIGLEWLFRLIQEPKRLWKRYLIGNTIFCWLVLKEFMRIRLFGKRD